MKHTKKNKKNRGWGPKHLNAEMASPVEFESTSESGVLFTAESECKCKWLCFSADECGSKSAAVH